MAKAAFIAAPNQRTAYINANVLDGTEGMEPLENHAVVVEGQRIVEVAPTAEADLAGCELVDLKGAYLLPGLINMHVHLAGNGKPQKKQRDNEALVKKVMANGLTRAIAYRLVAEYARLELHSGVTTIRTVGGLGDFDTRVRDAGAAGRLDAPRILAANQGISVPGGHMAGSVAIAARSIPEALAQVDVARSQGADLIKLMITGGVLDAKEKGTPGELKMDPAMVRAVCDRAHELGFTVAAHVESTEGVRVALEGGVSRSFALHTATLRNAQLAGVGDVTGSIEVGKDADMIVVDANPLDDLCALRTPRHVIHRGRFIAKPNVKRNAVVDRELDKFL